ncbi:hypothetical protein GCM10009804_36680 [Kribbella hippodromi]|uniref:Uncharacterized protein n=2 Tax=Kribbella hippodromi TaxID=434347 RepID=A0ABN2DIR5_9ACTN
MIELSTYDIAEPVTGDDYGELLRVLAPVATRFGLIVQMPFAVLHEPAREVLERLGGHLVDAMDTQAWPGSQIVGRMTVERFLFRLDAESLEVLVSSASSLYDWVNPMLPEDLHFLRSDGSVVLGTVAQEDDAWLQLTPAEYEGIAARIPRGVVLRRA